MTDTVLYHGTDCADITTFHAQSQFTADYSMALSFALERSRFSGKAPIVYAVIGDVCKVIETRPVTVYQFDSWRQPSLDNERIYQCNEPVDVCAVFFA